MRIIHEDSRSNDALWKQLSTEKEKEGVWGDYEVVSVEIGDQGEEATWGADRGGVGEVGWILTRVKLRGRGFWSPQVQHSCRFGI